MLKLLICIFNNILSSIKNKPALLLLAVVYLVFLPHLLSRENTWMHPEEFSHKGYILATQPCPEIFAPEGILNWKVFEYLPRSTRPLSSLFETIDTFFRSWLWNFIVPHPSLSLTWIFTLLLTPLLLYRILRHFKIDPNTTLIACSFYLMNPATLSWCASLFRPAKPMVEFCMILAFFLACRRSILIKKNHSTANNSTSLILTLLTSCFFDETGLLVLPAIICYFPSIMNRRYWFPLAITPLLVLWSYWHGIPWLTSWAGFPYPYLSSYEIVSHFNIQSFATALQIFPANIKATLLDTFGLTPYDQSAPMIFQLLRNLSILVIGTLLLISLFKKAFNGCGKDALFLAGLMLIHNFLLFITGNNVWGAFYYSTFSGFFLIIISTKIIAASKLNQYIVTTVCFVIIANMTVCFSGMNAAYKKYHFYPYLPIKLEDVMTGRTYRFNPSFKSTLSGGAIVWFIKDYWEASLSGAVKTKTFILPKELLWLPIERGQQNVVCDSEQPIIDTGFASFSLKPNAKPTPYSYVTLTLKEKEILAPYIISPRSQTPP